MLLSIQTSTNFQATVTLSFPSWSVPRWSVSSRSRAVFLPQGVGALSVDLLGQPRPGLYCGSLLVVQISGAGNWGRCSRATWLAEPLLRFPNENTLCIAACLVDQGRYDFFPFRGEAPEGQIGDVTSPGPHGEKWSRTALLGGPFCVSNCWGLHSISHYPPVWGCSRSTVAFARRFYILT